MALFLRVLLVLAVGLGAVFASPLNAYGQSGGRQTRQLDSLLKLHGERPEAYDFQLPRQYYYFNRGAGFPASAFSNSGSGSSTSTSGSTFSNGSPGFSRYPYYSTFASNGLTSNGLTSSGLTSSGLTSSGLTSSGLTSSGLTSSGLTSSGSFARPDPHYATKDTLTVRDRQSGSLIGLIAR